MDKYHNKPESNRGVEAAILRSRYIQVYYCRMNFGDSTAMFSISSVSTEKNESKKFVKP